MRDAARLFGRAPTWLCLLALASCGPAEPAREPHAEVPAAEASDAVAPDAVAPDAVAPTGASTGTEAPRAGAPESAENDPATASAAGSEATPSAPAKQSRGPAAAATPGHSVHLDSDDNLDADIAELSRQTKGGTEKAAENKGRDVVYRVTPKGLVIEIEGIHFRPEVKAVRDKQGAYQIVLTLNAESFDERQYWLRTPDEGPLAIAGSLADKAGKSQRFVDQRQGNGEEVVMAGQPRAFKQRWPGRGQPKLRAGQTVTLEVGLWGVRAESEREHPIRRLFMIKMLATGRPEPVVTPPTADWGG